jgi:uncharacterized protein YqjF (DUF2071 family)
VTGGATAARVFLSAEWLNLVLLNYVVPGELLAPFIPKGTELDLWRGDAYVSVVGFMFAKTRVLGVPIPFHRTFEEVNLRFYVKRIAGGEERRAVTFIRELVPRAAIAITARMTYNEPYRHLPMSHRLEPNDSRPTRAEYRWTDDGGSCGVVADGIGALTVPSPDSEEAFMTQRHWGYTRQRDGSTVEYRVAHSLWNVGRIERGNVIGDTSRLFGGEFASILEWPPASALFADGSAIAVHKPVRLA